MSGQTANAATALFCKQGDEAKLKSNYQNIMANDISKNTSGQPDSEHDQYDLEKELRAMDDFIERLKVRRMALGQLNRSLVPSRSFLDELIDVNCTPLGQNIENHYPGAWYSLFDVWQLVGSYLSEAMSYEQKR